VDAQDGQTALGKVSRKEVTRISVERGRIRKVTGNAGEFVLEKDDEKGQVFIRPGLAGQHQAHQPLRQHGALDDRAAAAAGGHPERRHRHPRGARRRASPARIERSGRHVRTMKNLLLAMAEDALPDDMEVREPGRDSPCGPARGSRCSGSGSAQAWSARSTSSSNTGASDARPRRARSLQARRDGRERRAGGLRPGETTQLFVIRERKCR
jgi:conjugal transfer pilus assembly protein TraK